MQPSLASRGLFRCYGVGLWRKGVRGLFGRSQSQLSTELRWSHALGLPDPENNISKELEDAADILLRSRWVKPGKEHVNGPPLLVTGHLRAQVALWEHQLLSEERATDDVLTTLRLIHLACIETGDAHQALMSLARSGMTTSGKARDPSHLGASYAMAAMAHQLNSQPQRAEELASRALGIDSRDTWAILALLESFHSQGRSREGLRLLRDLESDWRGSPMEGLLIGRKCFLELEVGNIEGCFRTMDDILQIGLGIAASPEAAVWRHWVRADISALTWQIRLGERFSGQETSNFAHHLDSIIRQSNEGLQVGSPEAEQQRCGGFDGLFNSISGVQLGDANNGHFLRPEQTQISTHELDDIVPITGETPSLEMNDIVMQINETSKPISKALSSTYFADDCKRIHHALRDLLRVRGRISRVGGLASIRDALSLGVQVEALRIAKETRTSESFRIARALSLERLTLKPTSPQTWFWHSELLELMGDAPAAESARVRATDLGLGQGGQFGD